MKDSANQPASKPNKVQFIEMPDQDSDLVDMDASETSPSKEDKSPPNEKGSPPALAPSISIDACEEPPAENDIKAAAEPEKTQDSKMLLAKP
ncbi:uncharacterized protein NPIL_613391 [Nephila pilipes]|uniref:Uncharacterized protein n=1 Tax=Nephila pilipes TaxID=299642 RepID=A0A8X6IS90_NEPPI|nr:uncharacterized protein NPIL_613391 [Nephila pilipes]